jgi:hypothetical protein
MGKQFSYEERDQLDSYKAKDYAKTVFSSSNFTVTTFGKCLKEIFGEYVKKSMGIIKYYFKTLDICKMKEHLYN